MPGDAQIARDDSRRSSRCGGRAATESKERLSRPDETARCASTQRCGHDHNDDMSITSNTRKHTILTIPLQIKPNEAYQAPLQRAPAPPVRPSGPNPRGTVRARAHQHPSRRRHARNSRARTRRRDRRSQGIARHVANTCVTDSPFPSPPSLAPSIRAAELAVAEQLPRSSPKHRSRGRSRDRSPGNGRTTSRPQREQNRPYWPRLVWTATP